MRIFIFIVFPLSMLLFPACQEANTIRTDTYELSLTKDFSLIERAEGPRIYNDWLIYRDAYYNNYEVSFTVQVFIDTLNEKNNTVDTVFKWHNYNKDKIEVVKNISVNRLPGAKISGIRQVLLDDQTYKDFFFTEWLLQGNQKVFNIRIGSYNKNQYESALESGEVMVSTFRERI